MPKQMTALRSFLVVVGVVMRVIIVRPCFAF